MLHLGEKADCQRESARKRKSELHVKGMRVARRRGWTSKKKLPGEERESMSR